MPKLNATELFIIEKVLNKTIMEDYQKRMSTPNETEKIYLDEEIAILNNLVAKIEAMEEEL